MTRLLISRAKVGFYLMADRTRAPDTPELRAIVRSCEGRNPVSDVAAGLLLSQEITNSGNYCHG